MSAIFDWERETGHDFHEWKFPPHEKAGSGKKCDDSIAHVRGRKTIDSYEFRSSFITPYIFEQLWSYGSSGYPVQMWV